MTLAHSEDGQREKIQRMERLERNEEYRNEEVGREGVEERSCACHLAAITAMIGCLSLPETAHLLLALQQSTHTIQLQSLL